MATYQWKWDPVHDAHELVDSWHPCQAPIVRVTRSDGGWCSRLVGVPGYDGLLSWGKNLDDIKRMSLQTVYILVGSGQIQ